MKQPPVGSGGLPPVVAVNLTAIALAGALFPCYGRAGVAALGGVLVIANAVLVLRPGARRRLCRMFDESRPFVRNALVVMMSIIVAFGGMELITVGLLKIGAITCDLPMRTVLKKGTDDWRLAHITADEYREPDPVLLWRPINRDPYNAQRFKGPVVALPKPAREFRMICYGDSNTEGPIRGAWPEALQHLLAERLSGGGRRYTVLNAGVAGYSSYQGLRRFRDEAGTYDPDVIVVAFGWNDLPAAIGVPDKAFRLPAPAHLFLERLLLHYHLYRAIKYYLGTRARPSPPAVEAPPRVSLDDYIQNLHGFLDEGRRHGMAAVFLTRPHRRSAEETAQDPTWMRNLPVYNRALLAFAKEQGAVAIDMQRLLSNHQEWFADECHLTAEGHQRMADMIFQEFLAHHLVPP